jgi:glucuronokinase
MIIETRAFARAGLLGNPSDGYFGKTISISIRNFGARILLYESPELVIEEQAFNENQYRSMYQLVESVKLTGYYGGSRLIKAAIVKFWEYCQSENIKIDFKNFTVRYQTSIPRQVGLAGSSAIVTATFKALIKFYNIEIPQHILPTLILKAETEELNINAGLQDRVIQVYEGCVYMDFEEKSLKKNGFGKYEQIKTGNLPNLYLAYKTELSKVSGTVFNNMKERYYSGDKLVIDTLKEIAKCAEDGRQALLNQDYDQLNKLINKNFDLRCKIMNISESNIELVNTARNCGASAKFSGSGGAIIGMYDDDEMLRKLIVDLRKINARVIKPYIE